MMPLQRQRILDSSDLPLAELSAVRLDGQVFPVDECFAPIDEFDNRFMRAQALARLAPRGASAELESAAWVYGALAVPPPKHRFCVDSSNRPRIDKSIRFIVRECIMAPGDLRTIEALSITSPQRTATEILRLSTIFGPREERLVSQLITMDGASADECAARLRARSNLVGTRRALARLSAAVAAGREQPLI